MKNPNRSPLHCGGMERLTKREIFALHAMAELCKSYWNRNLHQEVEQLGSDIETAISEAAVSLADRMLEVLNREE